MDRRNSEWRQSLNQRMRACGVEDSDTGLTQNLLGQCELVYWVWVAKNCRDIGRTLAGAQDGREFGAADVGGNDGPSILII
jgi:hypothetical protein